MIILIQKSGISNPDISEQNSDKSQSEILENVNISKTTSSDETEKPKMELLTQELKHLEEINQFQVIALHLNPIINNTEREYYYSVAIDTINASYVLSWVDHLYPSKTVLSNNYF